MKTVTVEFPIEEAMDAVRLLRAESRCLIENGDALPDIDVLKRAQHVLSARERIVSALEEVAGAEDEPGEFPQFTLALDGTKMPPEGVSMEDHILAAATTGEQDGLTPVALNTLPESLRNQVLEGLKGTGINPDEVQVATLVR